MFAKTTTDTGVYTLTLQGDLSVPALQTPGTNSTGSLSGTVEQGDGSQTGNETGLSGVTVFIDENGTGTYETGDPTTTTDSQGNYTFTDLAAGTYTVYAETPNGYTQTSPASNAGVSGTVTVGQSTTLAPIDEVAQGGNTISGVVYDDVNGTGTLTGGDTGLAGWYVYVDTNNTGSYTYGDPYTQTDANGNYTFQNAPAGTYTIRVYAQPGYTTTQGANGESATVTSGQSATNVDFGETQGANGGSSGITGTVYGDLQGDSNDDSGDPGLAGWTVYIDVNQSGSYVSGDPTATTDANGTYTFTGLAPGNYTIGIVPQAGYSTTEGSDEWDVTTTAGTTVNGGNFGESQATGSIYGTVYNAANDYGIYNWAVYVDLNNSGTYETGDPYYVTGSSGGYTITGLAPGTYTIRAAVYPSLPWVATAGSAGYTVTVVGNQSTFSGDFGERYI